MTGASRQVQSPFHASGAKFTCSAHRPGGNYDRLATHPAHTDANHIILAAIFACLVQWLHLAVPPLETGFVVLLLSYLVLLAGNVFRGL
jgi:hypothetical protein